MLNSRKVPVAAAALTALLALALAPPALANQPPEILSAEVTPSSLPYVGGPVTVSAQVADFEGAVVGSVDVEFTSGPFTTVLPLSAGSGYEWTGIVELPPNLSPDPVTWRFRVIARDLDFAETFAPAGEVVVAGYPGADEPPAVSDPSISPRELPRTGGPVELAVTAFDPTGLREVFAIVTGPGGGINVPLQSVGDDRFRGVFDAPANPGPGAVEYTVRLLAVDPLGQTGEVDGGRFRVTDRPSGLLELKATALDFGTTKVGKRRQRSVVLRNAGPKSSLPVRGVITTSGAPFFVAGAPATGLPFCLRAGKTMKVLVEFRPTAAGARTGTLTVSRPDAAQPPLAVALTGTGTARNLATPALAAAPAVGGCP